MMFGRVLPSPRGSHGQQASFRNIRDGPSADGMPCGLPPAVWDRAEAGRRTHPRTRQMHGAHDQGPHRVSACSAEISGQARPTYSLSGRLHLPVIQALGLHCKCRKHARSDVRLCRSALAVNTGMRPAAATSAHGSPQLHRAPQLFQRRRTKSAFYEAFPDRPSSRATNWSKSAGNSARGYRSIFVGASGGSILMRPSRASTSYSPSVSSSNK